MPTTTIQRYHGSYLMPSLEHATVADAMHPGIVSCETDSTVREVARIMATYHVHCVAIMHPPHDQSDAPYLWGIVSDLDLMRASISTRGEVTAGDLAQQPVISVKPTTMLRDAAELMQKAQNQSRCGDSPRDAAADRCALHPGRGGRNRLGRGVRTWAARRPHLTPSPQPPRDGCGARQIPGGATALLVLAWRAETRSHRRPQLRGV